jgi:hypothetical protein
MFPLRQSTAGQIVPLGMFPDSTDGDTEETGLTIANTDVRIHKAGATSLTSKNSGGATHMAAGIYYATLDATDSNAVGPLVIFVHVAGALACRLECFVYEEPVYDALFGAGALGYVANAPVNAAQIGGQTATAAAAITVGAFVGQPTAAIGVNASGHVSRAVLVDTTTALTNLPAITANWLTAAGIAADALLAIANKVEAEIIDETDSEKVLAAITDKIASVNPSLSGLTLAAIAAAVRDITNAAPAAGSLGEKINSINAKTTNLPSDPADASDVAGAFAALQSHGDSTWAGTGGLDAAGVRDALGLAAADLDDQLGTILAASGSAGTGAFAVTVKVTTNGTTPIVGATVRITGAQFGLAISDGNGLATFALDAGSVVLSVTAPGYYCTPTTQTVDGAGLWVSSAADQVIITMTANPTVTPSADPAKTTCFFTVRNAALERMAGVVFRFDFQRPVAGLVDAWSTLPEQEATSDANGLVQVELAKECVWLLTGPPSAKRRTIQFSTANAGTTKALPQYVADFEEPA